MADNPHHNEAANSSFTDQTVIAKLLDELVDDVVQKDRISTRLHKSTAPLFRCEDPSAIVVAHSYEEMIRIIEEYQSQPENEFHKFSCGISSKFFFS